MEKEKKIIIYGEAGSGKTCTLKWLHSKFTGKYLENKKNFFPFYISLDSYVNGSFYEYVKAKAKEKGINEPEFKNLLEGKTLLLLDGLDQLPHSRGFFPFKEISDFISEYEDCRYVITSRPGFYYIINYSVAVCEMEQLNDEKIANFIELYVPDKKYAEPLKTRAFNGEVKKSVIRTPFTLFLWLKTAMFRLIRDEKYTQNSQPAIFRRTDVYQAFISELFITHETAKGETLNSTEISGIQNILKELAFRLQCRNKASCDYHYALEIAEEYLKKDTFDWDYSDGGTFCISSRMNCKGEDHKTKDCNTKDHKIQNCNTKDCKIQNCNTKDHKTKDYKIQNWNIKDHKTKDYNTKDYKAEGKKFLDTCLAIGLLTKNGQEIRFGTTRSFQEYFAALKLKADFEKGIDISEFFECSEWKNVLILCSEMLENEVSGNIAAEDGSSGDVTAGDGSSGNTIADILINSIIHQSGDLYLASSCAETAGTEAQEKLCSLLAERLDSRYTVEKIRVVRSLGKLGAKGIEEIPEAFHDEDISVRMEAARVLGKTEAEAALFPLICALGDRDSSVRREAVKALGKLGSNRAIELLAWAFQDEMRTVRLEATEALAQIGSENSLNVLISALDSEDDFVRIGAIGALSRLDPRKGEDILIKTFLKGNQVVKWGAAEALGQMRSEKSIGMFLEYLENEDEFTRWMTVKTLTKIKSEQTFGFFVKALGDENRSVRREAAKALGILYEGKKDTVPASLLAVLTVTLADEDEFVRKTTVETLGEIGARSAVDQLIDLLGDQSHLVRIEAVKALGKIESEKILSPLLFALGDENRFVRKEAGKALRKLELEKILEPLMNAFLSQEELTRLEVVRILGFIISDGEFEREVGFNDRTEENSGTEENGRTEENSGTEENGRTEENSGKDKRLKGRQNQIFTTLDNALEDRDRFVRREAAKALGNLFGQKLEMAFKSLLKALEDEDPEVRRLASRAFKNLDSESTELLLFALSSEDEVVKRLAAEALGRLKSKKAIKPLIELALSNGDGFVRREAARALGHIGSKKAIEPLIDALMDKSNTGRWGAAEALGRLKAKNAVIPLINALLDSDDFARWAAAKALGRIKTQKAVIPLINTLHDRNRFVKAEAASSIAEICTKENISMLKELLNSNDPFEANLAFETLEVLRLKENTQIKRKYSD